MKIRVKFSGSGTEDSPFFINLPAYIITKSFPDGSVEINVPDDEVDSTGKLDKTKIQHKYRGQKWDRLDVTDDIIYV